MYKVIVFGQKVERCYTVEGFLFNPPCVQDYIVPLDRQVILYDGETEEPILKNGDSIFIPSLNTYAIIEIAAKI